MRKVLVLFTAAMLAGSALTGAAVASDRVVRDELSANQIADQISANTARIKAELRLTPEQEKKWGGFESAVADIGRTNADREIAWRNERAQQKGPIDIIEQMRQQAKSMGERSVDRKTLADAAAPLYASLDDQQKQRFAQELTRMNRGPDID